MNDYKTFDIIQEYWNIFSSLRKKNFLTLLLFMVISSFAEVISIGSIVPLLGVVLEIGTENNNRDFLNFIEGSKFFNKDNILIVFLILFCFIAIFSGILRVYVVWLSTRLSHQIGSDLTYKVFSSALYRDYESQIEIKSGEIINGATVKVNQVLAGISASLVFLNAFIMMLFIITTLMYFNFEITLYLGLIFIFSYFFIFGFSRSQIKIISLKIADKSTAVVSALQNGLGGIKEIIIGKCQPFYLNFFNILDKDLRMAQAKSVFLSNSPRYIIETLGILLMVITIFIFNLQEGGVVEAIPLLAVFALGAQKLLPVFQQIYSSYTNFLATKDSAIDIIQLIKSTEQNASLVYQTSEKNKIFFDQISFKNVYFKYKNSNEWVLENLNFVIPRGSFVCVVGDSGSGKSTLIDIILGLLQPNKGFVYVNDKIVTKNKLSDHFQLFSHVPQDIFLLDVSIAENIALGVPIEEIDQKKLRKVAKISQISSFIDNLPKNYLSDTGEQGSILSGGQKQRIAVARALYKDSSVIIFDEATSALDTETEDKLIKTLLETKKERTLISITHRKKHLNKCDIVIKIKNKNIEVIYN